MWFVPCCRRPARSASVVRHKNASYYPSMPRLTAAQQQQFAALVAEYITAQRDQYDPRSRPLTDAEKQPLRAFFTPELLESVRVLQLPRGESIANPDFYPQLEAL